MDSFKATRRARALMIASLVALLLGCTFAVGARAGVQVAQAQHRATVIEVDVTHGAVEGALLTLSSGAVVVLPSGTGDAIADTQAPPDVVVSWTSSGTTVTMNF